MERSYSTKSDRADTTQQSNIREDKRVSKPVKLYDPSPKKGEDARVGATSTSASNPNPVVHSDR
jgi:hypothetical protein